MSEPMTERQLDAIRSDLLGRTPIPMPGHTCQEERTIQAISTEARRGLQVPQLLAALGELVHQVEISGATDPLGHKLENLQALEDARRVILQTTRDFEKWTQRNKLELT